MKYIFCCVVLFIFFSCQDKKNNTAVSANDTIAPAPVPVETTIPDSAALPLSKEILTAIKAQDYQKLASFIKDSIRFSPYGYIDTANDKVFAATDLLYYATNKKNTKFTWGSLSGSGEPILLIVNEYFKRFVYDVDFLNAPQISLNKTAGKGNSLNNVTDVYNNCVYTEFYFPGFEKKYEGMDWRSLKLVFKKDMNKLYLVAVIHDQWTI